MWRALLNRIPIVDAPRSRNCYADDLSCVLCEFWDESVNHILCSCYIAAIVWAQISSWCKVDPIYAFTVKDLLEAVADLPTLVGGSPHP
ncbi:putative reverse transcriptase zinc-binding domain-containing protein [Helianthus annuus]|nr:putative reverse transcriptase zinc-binding domain-containing protein [Helianthus annuus]